MNISKITPNTIANELSVAEKEFSKQRMVERVSTAKLAVDLNWDRGEFYIDFRPNNDIEYQLAFTADTDVTSWGKVDTIIEFKNISLKEVIVDSYTLGNFEVSVDEDSNLVGLIEKLIHDANFYGLEPDEYTTITTDTDGAKSSLEDSVRSNEQYTMELLGLSNADFI